jgi:hypothetical protein
MEKLKFIKEQMDSLSINYEYGEWTSAKVYPYFTGEVTEEPVATEDGYEESTLILEGFHRGKEIDILREKEKIKKHFHPIVGNCAKTGSGSIAVFFDGFFSVPTWEAELKRIQITLKIKEWKGEM